MRTILLEKFKPAADYAAVLGAKRRPVFKEGSLELGRITAGRIGGRALAPMETVLTWSQGHILEPAPPAHYLGVDREEDAYAHWDWEKLPLLPDIKLEAKDEMAWLVAHISRLLKKTTELILATDGDDEGELIGYELIQHAGYKGPIHRCMTSGFDQVSYRTALDSLIAAGTTAARAEAAAARRDKDWKIGFNLSPAASLGLIPRGLMGVTFPVGRVKTPTMAMVVQRERAIREFRPETYFGIEMTVRPQDAAPVRLLFLPGGAGQATEEGNDDEQAPAKRRLPSEPRLLDPAVAALVQEAAATWAGLLTMQGTNRKQAPDPLYSGSDLLADASKLLGGSLKHWEAVRQSLYEQGAITYPRAAGRCLEEHMVSAVPQLLAAASTVPGISGLLPTVPVLRSGRGKTFDDAALDTSKGGDSHHAVVPNINSGRADWTKYQGDEQRLFALVALRTAMAFLPDHEYRVTTLAAAVPTPAALIGAYGESLRFKTEGKAVIALGWRALLPHLPARKGKARSTAREVTLPAIADGTPASATGAELTNHQTKPPPHFTLGSLVAEMGRAHKYVTDPALSAMLRAAKGIGTEATKDKIIDELLQLELLVLDKDEKLHPTPAGETEYDGLMRYTPELVDPGVSALLEHDSNRIRTGDMTRDQDRARTDAWIVSLVDRLRQAEPLPVERFGAAAAQRFEERSKPSEEKLAYARSVSEALGIPLPDAAGDDFTVCSAFLDAHLEAYKAHRAEAAPKEQQLKFAETIAATLGIALPDDARARAQACSAFIDKNLEAYKAKRPPRPSGGVRPAGKKPGGQRGGTGTKAAGHVAARQAAKRA